MVSLLKIQNYFGIAIRLKNLNYHLNSCIAEITVSYAVLLALKEIKRVAKRCTVIRRGKFIGVVAASLSAVSLMGVGFATWIIGVQKTTIDGSIGVVADDVKYKALTISVDFQDTLTLAEEAKTGEKPV